MSANIKLNVVGHVTATTEVTPGGNLDDSYETMSPPATPDEDIYESVSPRGTPEPTKGLKAAVSQLAEGPQGYLVPYPDGKDQGGKCSKFYNGIKILPVTHIFDTVNSISNLWKNNLL